MASCKLLFPKKDIHLDAVNGRFVRTAELDLLPQYGFGVLRGERRLEAPTGHFASSLMLQMHLVAPGPNLPLTRYVCAALQLTQSNRSTHCAALLLARGRHCGQSHPVLHPFISCFRLNTHISW